MNQETRESGGPRATVAGWITATLSTAAGCAIAFGVWLALGTADTEPLESPLMLSVARQLDHGPWGLYGPFGGQNPLVLIHAPLYYHLAAIAAWVVRQGGSDPITAARLAGRGLSLAGLLITAWCALRIARLDGPRPRAGWWAACLCAAAPVVGTMPYTVRPDMLGVAVQTTGVLLVLKALGRPRPAGRLIAGGFAALGLAICIKQHLAGGLFVSTALLLWEWGRGRVSSRLVGLAMLTAAGVVAVVYGVEEVATEGRMSTALLVAAPAIARVHPADPVRGDHAGEHRRGKHLLDRTPGFCGAGAGRREAWPGKEGRGQPGNRGGRVHAVHSAPGLRPSKRGPVADGDRRALRLRFPGNPGLCSHRTPGSVRKLARSRALSVCGRRNGDRRSFVPGEHRRLGKLCNPGDRLRRDLDGQVVIAGM